MSISSTTGPRPRCASKVWQSLSRWSRSLRPTHHPENKKRSRDQRHLDLCVLGHCGAVTLAPRGSGGDERAQLGQLCAKLIELRSSGLPRAAPLPASRHDKRKPRTDISQVELQLHGGAECSAPGSVSTAPR